MLLLFCISSFGFQACFKMKKSEKDASGRTGLYLKYVVKEDFYDGQVTSRVSFDRDLEKGSSVIERSIQLRPQDFGKFRCIDEIAYIRVILIILLYILKHLFIFIFI